MLFSGFFLKRDLYKIYKLYNLTMIQDAYTCWCRLSFWAGDQFAESDTWITLCHLQSVVCAHVRTCACVSSLVGGCMCGRWMHMCEPAFLSYFFFAALLANHFYCYLSGPLFYCPCILYLQFLLWFELSAWQ